ncbi:MAG TPA: hypothetical protein ENN85_07805 [Methanoculleus sp.]|nr:hypothetical protein [Methanoculleus sp.]
MKRGIRRRIEARARSRSSAAPGGTTPYSRSPPGVLACAQSEHRPGPPLPHPRALSAGIHRHGNVIAGVQVRRPRHHSYRLTIDLAGAEGTEE